MGDVSPQASSFEYLLEECRNLFCERLRAAMAGMLEKADESLAMARTASSDRGHGKLDHIVVKADVSTTKKLTVVLPKTLEKYMTTKGGQPVATRFRVRVLGQ